MNNEINRITSVLKKTDAFCQTDKFILEAIAKRLYKLEIAQNEPLWTNLNYIPDFFVVLKGSIEITSGSLVCSLAVNDYFWKPNFEAFRCFSMFVGYMPNTQTAPTYNRNRLRVSTG